MMQVYDRVDHDEKKSQNMQKFMQRTLQTLHEEIETYLKEMDPHAQIVMHENQMPDTIIVDETPTWYVQALDGIKNLRSQIPHFTICLTFAHSGKLSKSFVYDVTDDVLYWAEQGAGAHIDQVRTRINDKVHRPIIAMSSYQNAAFEQAHLLNFNLLMLQCDSLAICWLAAAKLSIFFSESTNNPLALMASGMIAVEAGAIFISVTDGNITHHPLQGSDLNFSGDLYIGPPKVLGYFLGKK